MKFNQPFSRVTYLSVTADHTGRRLDNFISSHLPRVPKNHILKIIRKGQVRVNMRRFQPSYRLQLGDSVRIPPVALNTTPLVKLNHADIEWMGPRIIYEDEQILVFNKPSGIACHRGSGLKFGIIDGLRQLRSEFDCLELAHRLDKGTSGCLLLAKNKSTLRDLHAQWLNQQVAKAYLMLTQGKWPSECCQVDFPLKAQRDSSGERVMIVAPEGKSAHTKFQLIYHLSDYSLVKALPQTGRTHQIRVHAASQGHPILGDLKYGARNNADVRRLCLHAYSLEFNLNGLKFLIKAPLEGIMEELAQPSHRS